MDVSKVIGLALLVTAGVMLWLVVNMLLFLKAVFDYGTPAVFGVSLTVLGIAVCTLIATWACWTAYNILILRHRR